MTELIHSPSEFQARCESIRRVGKRVGFVPTMGALHEGHLALLDHAREKGAEFLAVSVFVNPMQFGPKEDFGRYPRTLDADVAACAGHGVDIVFAPAPSDMYPPGFSSFVEVQGVSSPLEGQFRPGHFRGVATVVAKLFALVGPCVAVFGRKDYQQWRVLSRMVLDLNLPIEMVGMPTVRERDGLALSSRNRYLSADERQRALAISRGLRAALESFRQGERSARALEQFVRAPIAAAFDSIDYVSCVDADDLRAIDTVETRALIAVASRIGTTRLIDNVVLGEDSIP